MNFALRLVIGIAIAYGAILLLVALLQSSLIYRNQKPKSTRQIVEDGGFRVWPKDNHLYRGLLAATPAEKAKGLVVIFHGNAGTAADRMHYSRALNPLGYNVLLVEYPGYGGRDGSLNEKSFVSDAKETVRRAKAELGGPIYLWGESLGCGIASAVAADPLTQADGVILVTPWDTLADLVQTLYWYFPAKWMLRDQYDNIRNLQKFDNPIAVLVAENDEIIPPHHAFRLFESLSPPKRKWIFPLSGHNNWPSEATEYWWQEVMDFVSLLDGNSSMQMMK